MSDERIAALEADSAFQAERIRELNQLVAFQARHMDDGWVAHNQVALDVERLEAELATNRDGWCEDMRKLEQLLIRSANITEVRAWLRALVAQQAAVLVHGEETVQHEQSEANAEQTES